MNKKISILVLVLAILFMDAHYSSAGEALSAEEITKEISNNISEEYITCSVYYFIASEGLKRSGDLKTAAKSEEAANKSLNFALVAANKGRTQEMAQKVTLARYELTMKSMVNEIDKDVSNMSVLINKYADRCKEIMEKPDKMMDEWADKILRKHNLK